MKYLLDTHVLIRWFQNPESLPKKIDEMMNDLDNQMFVSIISLWEIVIKLNIKKLELKFNIQEMIEELSDSNIEILPIKQRYLDIYLGLPLLHKDPFDRLLISTALSEQIPFITSDNKNHLYPVEWIWEGN